MLTIPYFAAAVNLQAVLLDRVMPHSILCITAMNFQR